MTKEFYEIDIEELLPHRDRMLLLDRIVGRDGDWGVCVAVPKDNWPLTGPEGVNSLLGLEMIAQTVAAMVGYASKEMKENNPDAADEVGYIVGVKKANFLREYIPKVDQIMIRAKMIMTKENYGVFRGVVSHDSTVYVDAELQVYRVAGDIEM